MNVWKNKESLPPFVVHELCHLITDPLYVKASQRYVGDKEIEAERERITDTICNIVLRISDEPNK